MCDEAVCTKPPSLTYVPDHFKTQEMCDEAVRREPSLLFYVPDRLKKQDVYALKQLKISILIGACP